MTKEQAKDLRSLIERVIDCSMQSQAADRAENKANLDLDAFCYDLQFPKVTLDGKSTYGAS